MPPPLDVICQEIGLIGPNFVFWTGDVIEGYGDTPAEAGAEYDTFLASAAKAKVPVFNAPGNHEYSLDKALVPVYHDKMGSFYGSFDYGSSHFIALNTTPILPDGSPGPGGSLDEPQWAWLEADLQANQGAKNIFVFMHHYVFGPPDPDTPDLDTGWKSIADRDRLHALMVKYHVRAVFCSHNHIYWHQVKDGVDYFITGGAGAPLDATPDAGGYLHYMQVTVDGTKVSTQVLQPWHLEVHYPDGDGVGTGAERVWVANTNYFPVTAGHITLHLAAPPAGQQFVVTAGVNYKSKIKATPAQIVSVKPITNGQDEVAVLAVLPRARTTEISVTTSAAKATK